MAEYIPAKVEEANRLLDSGGNIYELTDEQKMSLSGEPTPESIEAGKDVARLEGFLKGRAEADKKRHEKFVKKQGKLVWDSQKQGTYRKSQNR